MRRAAEMQATPTSGPAEIVGVESVAGDAV
jgi:hypothetical protein